jgi:hypothetical protein
MHKTTIYLHEALYERIRRLADATGRTHAAVVREALEEYLGGHRVRRPRSVGLGVGAPDLSTRAEELLRGMGEEA